jgi:chromosome partitioning protein
MTITTPFHNDVCKEEQVDRRVDVQTDGRKAAGKDSGCPAAASAFVIVLANHKGGVTKTTSTANLGATFAEAGRRVLIVDCDPQANLSEAFGWVEELPGERLEDLLANPDAVAGRYTPPTALQPDVAPGLEWRERLRIIPSTDALADVAADLPLTGGPGYELRLREVLEPLRARFDLVLLDTPPGLGTLSGMAVLAADGLVIPALAADLDVRGAGKLYDLVEGEIPGLRILGVLLAASERRWRVTRDATDRMTADGMRVLPVQVPRAVRVASAPRHRAPTVVLEPDSMVSHAYRQLAHHLLGELGR